MRKPSSYSPFAAMTQQQQMDRWTVWQAQQHEMSSSEDQLDKKQTDVCSLSSELPVKEPDKVSITPQPNLKTGLHHRQYDAVIKRMKQASGQTGRYQNIDGASSTTQSASGKP